MALAAKEQKHHSSPLAFEGLNEKELASLYRLGSIKKVNAGDVLLREGDSDTSLRFVLEGSVRIAKNLNGRVREVALLSQSDSLEEIAFMNNGRRVASATAAEPSTIMVLDEESVNALSRSTQLSIYRNLNDLITKRFNDLIEEKMTSCSQNQYLISYIQSDLESRNNAYARWDITQKILKRFPRLPMYASQLAVRLLDEDVSVSEVVDSAKLDPSLVGMVLKTVNSAYYNLQRKISNFQQAVLLLGFNQIYQLVIANGIRDIMPNTSESHELQFHSMMVSHLSFEISQLCSMKKGAIHSTVGLLHDIGKSVILLLKQQYPKLEMIVDMLGHGRIGSLLLKEWNIPDVVCLSVEYQYYPEFSPPAEIPEESREYVAVLYLAHLCYAYLQGDNKSDLQTPFMEEYMDLMKISEKSVAELVKKNILQLMIKKLQTFPEEVRQFLIQAETRLLEETCGEPTELPIFWNI